MPDFNSSHRLGSSFRLIFGSRYSITTPASCAVLLEVSQRTLPGFGYSGDLHHRLRRTVRFRGLLSRLEKHRITISMVGRGRALDNVMVERLWRSVRQECSCPRALAGGAELKKGFQKYFRWDNGVRPNQSLDNRTPDEVYF